MKYKLAYIKNLKDSILNPESKDIIAICPCCGAEYSANKGDYWNCNENEALTCCDGIICELVRKQTKLIPA